MSKELTDKQIEQLDLMDNTIFDAVCTITGKNLKWDIEWIGELADHIVKIAEMRFGLTEMEIYPYFDSEENDPK